MRTSFPLVHVGRVLGMDLVAISRMQGLQRLQHS